MEYNKYIVEHINNVKKAFEEFGDTLCMHLNVNKDTLRELVDKHDLSKFGTDEFEGYRQFFYPKDGEEKSKTAMDMAWLHHMNTNPHHPQYWELRDGEASKTLDMPSEYIAEMILDWQAMSYKFGGTPLTYYNESGKYKKFSGNTRVKLEQTLKSLYK